jgi:hypothetical protein
MIKGLLHFVFIDQSPVPHIFDDGDNARDRSSGFHGHTVEEKALVKGPISIVKFFTS